MKRLAVISAILCLLAMASARVADAGSSADRMRSGSLTNHTDGSDAGTAGGFAWAQPISKTRP